MWDVGRVEKSGPGFRKSNHDVAVVPRNSSVIIQLKYHLFWIYYLKVSVIIEYQDLVCSLGSGKQTLVPETSFPSSHVFSSLDVGDILLTEY